MKKIIATIILAAAAAATLCACNDGQTGGGQNLNDTPERTTVYEDVQGDDMPPHAHRQHRRHPHSQRDRHAPRGQKGGDCPNCGNRNKN